MNRIAGPLFGTLAALLFATGCAPGEIGDGVGSGIGSGPGPGSGTGPNNSPGQTDPGPPSAGQLRRLSPAQFRRSLQDLLGNVGMLPPTEEAPAGASLKAIGASITAFSPLGIEQFETAVGAALDVVWADTARRDSLVGCMPAAWDEACARSFVRAFGRRAWRRPLTADEENRYVSLGSAEAADSKSFPLAARAIASGLLQSPHFLYRVEIGGSPIAGAAYSRFTGYETASRLSYLFWGTTPDATGLDAAATGALDTPEGVHKEVDRLLASNRVVDGFYEMVEDLMSLDAVDMMSKDTKLFPQLTPTLRQAMRQEILRMFRDAALDRDADLMELYSTDRTFVNAELGNLYGVTTTGTDVVAVQLPADQPRAGLLTASAILAVQDKPYQTSPTRRGAFFWRSLMCTHIPDPPPGVNVNIQPPPAGVVLSRRQLLAGHATDPSCAGCHGIMDPIGLAFENFDAMGAYRTKDENGQPIDAHGELNGKPFAGPRELGMLLRQSDEARACMTRRIYRFATGRNENGYDDAQIALLDKAFNQAGRKFKSLVSSLAVSDGFRNVSLTK